MPLYDYHCADCGEVTEERRGLEDYLIPCPLCGGTAHRAACSGLPAIWGETVGRGFSTSRAKDQRGRYRVSNFQEASAEIDYAHTRAEQREGRKLKAPSLYKTGLRRAQQMGAKIRRR